MNLCSPGPFEMMLRINLTNLIVIVLIDDLASPILKAIVSIIGPNGAGKIASFVISVR